MEMLVYGFVGAAAAFSFWIWTGSPNSETGEYVPDMLLSAFGKYLLLRWHKTRRKIFKLFLCPYCLSPWLAVSFALASGAHFWYGLLAGLCTAPFAALFFLIYKHL